MKRQFPLIPATIATLLLPLSLAVQAGTDPDQPHDAELEMASKPDFSELDANQDGVLTIEEATDSWLERAFAEVDANQDGVIDRNEYDSAA